MAEIECFMVEPTGKQRRALRRYRGESECPTPKPGRSYHDAEEVLGEAPEVLDEEGYIKAVPLELYEGDPRWPTHCACGYEFAEEDHRQIFTDTIYAAEDGREWIIRELPAGAMFDTPWIPRQGPDGLSLSVVVPNVDDTPDARARIWHIDYKASSGGYWTREGTPPKITVQPSIQAGPYHGWLRDGKLVDA